MKKLLIIPALCIMFLLMQGSKQTDFTYIVDSLKSGSDTTDEWNIDSLYHTLYQHQYLTWNDTGTGEVDSVSVYGTDAKGNKFLCQLEYLSTAAVTKGLVTSNVGVTAMYKIIPEFLKEIEIVRNGNAIYTANVRGDYTITLVNE